MLRLRLWRTHPRCGAEATVQGLAAALSRIVTLTAECSSASVAGGRAPAPPPASVAARLARAPAPQPAARRAPAPAPSHTAAAASKSTATPSAAAAAASSAGTAASPSFAPPATPATPAPARVSSAIIVDDGWPAVPALSPSSTSSAPSVAGAPTDEEIHEVIEFVQLYVPHDDGMAVSDVFAALAPEQRSVVKRYSRLLGRFLAKFPQHFAVSPGGTVVFLGAADSTAAIKAAAAERLIIGAKNLLSPGAPGAGDASGAGGLSHLSSTSQKNLAATIAPPSAEDQQQLVKLARGDAESRYVPVTAVQAAAALERAAASSSPGNAQSAGGGATLAAGATTQSLERIPPPDLFSSSTASTSTGLARVPLDKRSIAGIFENNLSTQTLVKFVPTWFVPCAEVVKHMEGYTEEHFQQFFGDAAAVEVITLADVDGCDSKFVRMHGGLKHKSLVDFDTPDARHAEELWKTFKPDARLALEVLKVCPARGQWIALFDVVRQLPPDVASRLPYQGPQSLMFFAQMQHIFSFSPNNGGGICVPHSLPTHLHWDSTPWVMATHHIFNGLMAKPAFVGDLLNLALPKHSPSRARLRDDFVRGLILARAVHGQGVRPEFAFECEPEKLDKGQIEDLMRVYVALHTGMFGYQRQQSAERTVQLRFEMEAEERQSLDIPAQIEVATQRGDKKRVRKLRRRMAAINQPDNPLLDEEKLAKAVSEFLPPDRSMSWLRLKRSLPGEILDVMPANMKRFLYKYPQYFVCYDVGVLTNFHLHLQQPHLPPPAGAFRKPGQYTDDELLSSVGQVLLRGPKTVAALCTALPNSIYETLKVRHGGVAQMVMLYPANFAFVIKDVRNKDLRTATVTLLQVPNLMRIEDDPVEAERVALANASAVAAADGGGSGAGDDDDGDDDGGGGRAGGNIWSKVIVDLTGQRPAGADGDDADERGRDVRGATRGDRDDVWSQAAKQSSSPPSPPPLPDENTQ